MVLRLPVGCKVDIVVSGVNCLKGFVSKIKRSLGDIITTFFRTKNKQKAETKERPSSVLTISEILGGVL